MDAQLATAHTIADYLVDDGPELDGVLLYGSVARGSANAWSDLDFLAVGQRSDISVGDLLRGVKIRFPGVRVSIVYLPDERLDEYLTAGTRFLVHVREEGRILRDSTGALQRALAAPFEPVPAEEEIEPELQRLKLYDDPTRYGDNFLFCFAHVYTIAKTIVMARLADDGAFEFDRDRAFDEFVSRWPLALPAVATIRELRPFFNLVSRRRPEPLPFDFRGCPATLSTAVAAVRELEELSSHARV